MRARGEGRYHPRQPSRSSHPRQPPHAATLFCSSNRRRSSDERLRRWTWILFRFFVSFPPALLFSFARRLLSRVRAFLCFSLAFIPVSVVAVVTPPRNVSLGIWIFKVSRRTVEFSNILARARDSLSQNIPSRVALPPSTGSLAHRARDTFRAWLNVSPNVETPQFSSSGEGTQGTPGWSTDEISAAKLPRRAPFFCAPSFALLRETGRWEQGRKGRVGRREEDSETVWLLPSDAWLGNSYNTTSLQEGFRFHPARRLEIYCSPVDCGFPDSPVCPYK